MADPVTAIAIASVLSAGVTAMSMPNTPTPLPAPKVPPPPVMPLPDDAAVAEAKAKSLAQQTARQGRASTILTGLSGGGGVTGSQTKLGG